MKKKIIAVLAFLITFFLYGVSRNTTYIREIKVEK